jgi:hypothetical protein
VGAHARFMKIFQALLKDIHKLTQPVTKQTVLVIF